ncbi:putative O-acetylhomoserine-lyase [Talaromyces proteolyticus]|uniref:O-acetylhomoserine-lyase n=1 Tax=Talaromyces proteolyticus TaxID=1131652 RepID=A0AAD4PSM1_9EURO|nr:putative O-acetylhomoserine-lyase [Talaromyces proteolyticus]KAH8691626.1 putative O-acetylhomoserine-lyase [Talaromyces proteolyticus]
MPDNDRSLQFESLSIHAGKDVHNVHTGTGAVTTPIYASTSFTFNDSQHGADIFAGRAEDYAYSRLGNPTLSVLEQRVAVLEGGAAALPAASGEAARWMAIAGLAMAGENIIAAATISEDAYTHFKFRFPSHGISVKFVNINDIDAVRNAIDEQTRAIYIESISSVSLEIADIEVVASVAHAAGVPLVVDNTAGAAGYLIRPIDHGADIVIHSSSEWITGSGTTESGLIVDSGKFPWKENQDRFPHLTTPSPGYHGLNFVEQFGNIAYILYIRMAILRDVGPCLNPFAAAFALAGLASLSPRIDRHNSNALALAKWLEGNEKVGTVIFPGLYSYQATSQVAKYLRQKEGYGAILHFTLKTSKSEDAKTLVGNLKMVGFSDGLGTAQSLAYVPYAGLASRPGISAVDDATIRVSVGLEHSDDIIEDFKKALESI